MPENPIWQSPRKLSRRTFLTRSGIGVAEMVVGAAISPVNKPLAIGSFAGGLFTLGTPYLGIENAVRTGLAVAAGTATGAAIEPHLPSPENILP